MYILLEYTRIIEPLSQCFDTQTIVIIIHRGRDVKILLLTILLDIVFKTMKINKIHYKVSKIDTLMAHIHCIIVASGF